MYLVFLPMKTSNLKILAIDTATEACSVSLNLGGTVSKQIEIAPNGHSKLVLGMVQSLLQQARLGLKQLDVLAVNVGPGSFTGLRIGIGVTQGLAYGAGLKVIPVGSLEVLAQAVPHQVVLAAIDARMQQIYYALYHKLPDGEQREIIQPGLIAPDRLVIKDQGEVVGTGSGWDSYAPVMTEAMQGTLLNWLPQQYPEASTLSTIAAARGLKNAISPLELTVCYIRNEIVNTPARVNQSAMGINQNL